jgi:antitoxin (DNA-binding transcriptional repressor) of toxin-antitoxin stability system
MTRTVTIDEAQMHLAELLAAVEDGEEVVIERLGEPVARISRCAPKVADKSGRIELGFYRGQVKEIDPDWWKPVKDEEIRDMFGDEFADDFGAP